MDPKVAATLTGDVRHGTRGGPPDVRILGGYFVFDSSDAVLLVSLLPALIHVRGAKRLSTLERLIGEESTDQRAGRLTPQHKLSVTRLLRGFAANARVLGRVIPRQRCLTRTA